MRCVAFQSMASAGARAPLRCCASRPAAAASGVRLAAPQQHKRRQQPQPRQARGDVRARFFKFGKNGMDSESAGVVGSQGRDEYCDDDVEAYFNYMGCLAEEGTYDRMYALSEGRHPIDTILLLAAPENDTPKIGELLKAGADPTVKDLNGKTALELATKAETVELIKTYMATAK